MASTRRIYLLLVLFCLSLVIVSYIPSVNSQALPGAPAPGGDAPKDGGKTTDPPKEPAGGDAPKTGGENKNPPPPDTNDNPKNPGTPPDNGDNGKGENKAPDNGGNKQPVQPQPQPQPQPKDPEPQPQPKDPQPLPQPPKDNPQPPKNNDQPKNQPKNGGTITITSSDPGNVVTITSFSTSVGPVTQPPAKKPNQTAPADDSSGGGSVVTAAIVVGTVVVAAAIGIWIFRKWKLSPSRNFKEKIQPVNFTPRTHESDTMFLRELNEP